MWYWLYAVLRNDKGRRLGRAARLARRIRATENARRRRDVRDGARARSRMDGRCGIGCELRA